MKKNATRNIVTAEAEPMQKHVSHCETNETNQLEVVADMLVPYMDVLRLATIGRDTNPSDRLSEERVWNRTVALGRKISESLPKVGEILSRMSPGETIYDIDCKNAFGQFLNPMLKQRGLPDMDSVLAALNRGTADAEE